MLGPTFKDMCATAIVGLNVLKRTRGDGVFLPMADVVGMEVGTTWIRYQVATREDVLRGADALLLDERREDLIGDVKRPVYQVVGTLPWRTEDGSLPMTVTLYTGSQS